MPDNLSKRRPLPDWEYLYPDSRNERIKELEKEVEFLSDQLSCLLDHVTDGLLSKTGYAKEVMYSAADDATAEACDEAVGEALVESNAREIRLHRALLRAARHIARIMKLGHDDGAYAMEIAASYWDSTKKAAG